jgi:hypothetical protein
MNIFDALTFGQPWLLQLIIILFGKVILHHHLFTMLITQKVLKLTLDHMFMV